jgi:hypothetical protein
MRGSKAGPKPIAKGAGKQFGGGGGKTPFKATPRQATAAMQGREPPAETPHKSISKAKNARRNTVKGGGAKVF